LVQIQGLFHDGHEDINGDCDPDLCLDSIFGGAIKGLDSEMLLDPLEKQLHLPAAAIEIGNRYGRQDKVVGKKHEWFVVL
jgi:hypothetical protein